MAQELARMTVFSLMRRLVGAVMKVS